MGELRDTTTSNTLTATDIIETLETLQPQTFSTGPRSHVHARHGKATEDALDGPLAGDLASLCQEFRRHG